MLEFLYLLIFSINSINFKKYIQGDWTIYDNGNSIASIFIHRLKSTNNFEGNLWINNDNEAQYVKKNVIHDNYQPSNFFIATINFFNITNANGEIKINTESQKFNFIDFHNFSITNNQSFPLILTAESQLSQIECLFYNTTQMQINFVKKQDKNFYQFKAHKNVQLHFFQWGKFIPYLFILAILLILLHTSMTIRAFYQQNAQEKRREQMIKALDEEGQIGKQIKDEPEEETNEEHLKTD